MIKNGNYVDGIYDEIKHYILDAFKTYYKQGDKKLEDKIEKIVNEKINSTSYYTFDDKDYVLEYYDRYITKYRNDILNKFYEKQGIERDRSIDKVLWESGKKLSEANINIAMLGGEKCERSNFTDEVKEVINNSRKSILDILGNVQYTDKEEQKKKDYKYIKSLHKQLYDCIKYVEKKNNCDVFKDINQMAYNEKKYMIEFLEYVNQKLDNAFDCDIKAMKKKDFSMMELEDLKSHEILFTYDLSCGGLLDAFSTEKGQLLKDRTVDIGTKTDIMCDRLLYLANLDTNIIFQYFQKEDIPNLKDMVNACLDQESFKNLCKNIKKEYKFQCSHCVLDVLGEKLKTMTAGEKDKFCNNWFDGNFFPDYLADDIIEQRNYYYKMLNNGVNFLPDDIGVMELYEYMMENNCDGVNTLLYEDGNMYKPFNTIFCLDRYSSKKEDYLSTMVHELNHSMAWHKPYEISKEYIKSTSGVSHHIIRHKGINVLDDVDIDNDTVNLEEYINERQAKDIKVILLDKLEENKVKWPVDNVMKDFEISSETYYDFYDFLFKDFYELFEKDLKLLNIDDSMEFSFDFLMPANNQEKVFSEIKRFANRNLNQSNYYRSGFVDNKNIVKLNKLADVFTNEIHPYQLSKNLTIAEMDLNNRRNIQKLPYPIQKKVYKLIKEKDKIMENINADYAKKMEYEKKFLDSKKNTNQNIEFVVDIPEDVKITDKNNTLEMMKKYQASKDDMVR